MNIGIVTTWFERGAAYVSKQYMGVLKNEHNVFIYARGGEKYAMGNKDWDGSEVTWEKKIPIGMPMSIDLNNFKQWIVKNNIEVVFFNEQQWWDPIVLCNKMGIKTGAYVDYYTKETVPFFGLYDFLICNTKRHYDVFSWHPQVQYIPWGTDIDLYTPKTLSTVKDNIITFFHSCGMSPDRKGTDLLIRAFTKLTGLAELTIHTQIDLKIFFPDLCDIISKLEDQGRLHIFHKTISAPGLYHLGDVYVYPSRLDGIGLTVAEALACGLPAIVPDNPPMSEFIDQTNGKKVDVDKFIDREDGYYWPICEIDQQKLAHAMQYYVDAQNNIEEYKKDARLYAEVNLDWKKNTVHLPRLFFDFKVLPFEERQIINNVILYENRRSNVMAKLYRNFPFVFKPFSWLWPVIKFFYIQK